MRATQDLAGHNTHTIAIARTSGNTANPNSIVVFCRYCTSNMRAMVHGLNAA